MLLRCSNCYSSSILVLSSLLPQFQLSYLLVFHLKEGRCMLVARVRIS